MDWREGFERAKVLIRRGMAKLRAAYLDRKTGVEWVRQRRLWFSTALGLDVLLVSAVALALHRTPTDLEAWVEVSYPVSFVVVRHSGDTPLRNVRLVLDGRYVHNASKVAPGLNGFELVRDFEDHEGLTPTNDYSPQALEVSTSESEIVVPLERRNR
jgi:hypothetical protein